MIFELTFHFEWHRGYLPRISFKRPPSQGRKFYDKGWGWRRYVMCGPCSGVGYFDAPLNDDRAVIWPSGGELNQAADETPVLPPYKPLSDERGDPVAHALTEEDLVREPYRPPFADRYGRSMEDDHYGCPHSQVHDQMCRPVPEQPNGDIARWESEGGRPNDLWSRARRG
jgi:hypothetical protein